jgi:hypothetical protein
MTRPDAMTKSDYARVVSTTRGIVGKNDDVFGATATRVYRIG